MSVAFARYQGGSFCFTTFSPFEPSQFWLPFSANVWCVFKYFSETFFLSFFFFFKKSTPLLLSSRAAAPYNLRRPCSVHRAAYLPWGLWKSELIDWKNNIFYTFLPVQFSAHCSSLLLNANHSLVYFGNSGKVYILSEEQTSNPDTDIWNLFCVISLLVRSYQIYLV